MKKIVFMVLLFSLFILRVQAFQINIDKIDVDSKTFSLTRELDSSYTIDIRGFSHDIINDEEATELTRKLVKISMQDDDRQTKKEKLVESLYISQSDGFETLTASMAIDLYLDTLEKDQIKGNHIKDIKTEEVEDGVMSFAYLDQCDTKDGVKNVILAFWMKKSENTYGLFYPWITTEEEINDYFNQVIDNELHGKNIGSSFKKMEIGEDNVQVSEEELNRLYNQNKDSVVQITGMKQNGLGFYGSGFFLNEGIVVTSWSLFKQVLNESNYVYVNDAMGNTYEVMGIVAIQSDYDLIILKLNKETGNEVLLGEAESLKKNEFLFMINSKNNDGFSINYGTNLSYKNGRLKNLFLSHESDVGAALFNASGEVVGIQTHDLLNSDLSYANSTEYLKKLQQIFNKQGYDRIICTQLEDFKGNYFVPLNEEAVRVQIDNKVWEKYKEIGKIEDTISLPLVKASYKDNILSLRYKNSTDKMIDGLYFVSNYVETLEGQGFKLTYEDKNKKIYFSNQYKIIMKHNLNYVIILMMEI